ncbi:MAG TPA: class II aldolase/adducin family protein [Fimbriimonas sp.]|nr:class II aldolase/adducin family protein [Fimbriimonas sp.]
MSAPPDADSALQAAVRLARALGRPDRDLAILAEGNTSARVDDQSFWVKASGLSLHEIDAGGFVRISFEAILSILEMELTDAQVKDGLSNARLHETSRMPSVETFMHAYLLSLPDVDVVGHTHPTPLISLLCRDDAEQIAKSRLFPDEVVCCGPAAAFVPYCDPGLPLARAIRTAVEGYVQDHGAVPKTIWLGSHGLIALGKTVDEVESATLMSAKAARVWLGALSSHRSLHTLTPEQIERIHSRPDEHYRQRLLWNLRKNPLQ